MVGCNIESPPPQPPPQRPPAEKELAYPETAVDPVTDDYATMKVVDNYRWLENPDDPKVRKWILDQKHLARLVLDKYKGQGALRKRISELKTGKSAEYFAFTNRPGGLFGMKLQPPKQQPFLVVMKSPDDAASARTLLDPSELDKTGGTTIDFYVPSLDGKLVAASLSKNGTEDGDVHVYDVASGRALPDVIPRVNGGTAGGSVAWNAKGTGLYYTRYPHKGERPDADLGFYQQVYYHELGAKLEQDKYVLGKEFPRIAEISLRTRDDGKYTLVEVANGDGGEFEFFVSDPAGTGWTQISKFEDKVTRAVFGQDGKIYLLSKSGAPKGKILRIAVDKPVLAQAETIVPEGSGVIRSFTPMATKLYVTELVGGPSKIEVYDLAGKHLQDVPLPPVAAVGPTERLDGDGVMYSVETFTQPPARWVFSGSGEPRKTPMEVKSPVDYSDAEVVRETCTSKDGTKVPINIIQKKGAPRNGNAPALLTGYGGFDLSMEPWFWEVPRIMLDVGGVWAIANLRGGGEFGEAWHDAGRLTKKQNVFDDFVACAEHLVRSKITNKDKLAIEGGSNGGLLMGAVVTQHPELFRVVVASVGIYDVLRSETWTNGVFNVPELGTVKNPEQLRAIAAYSPYHHVVEGTSYPAMLLTTGVNDPRVAPWQSRKMAARLQSATAGPAPILLLTRDTGHGIGNSLSEEIDELVDTYSFVFGQMDIEFGKK